MSEAIPDERGCKACHRTWPQVTFREMARAISTGGDIKDVVCDSCLATDSREGQIAEKVDEAQAVAREVPLIRQVVVTGIKSGTNVIGFRYPTHVKLDALTITDLLVTFKNGQDYLYKSVPVAVAEGWMGAPSLGKYFIEQIKNSYDHEQIEKHP